MKWSLRNTDIFEADVDVLVCSANVQLNLSGGVGGELLVRYGSQVQEALYRAIAHRTPPFATPGEVFAVECPDSPYKIVLHAVAVDCFYKSSCLLIQQTVERALQMASKNQASTVALAALATGYGNLTMADFARGLAPLRQREYPPIEEVVICVDSGSAYRELVAAWKRAEGADLDNR